MFYFLTTEKISNSEKVENVLNSDIEKVHYVLIQNVKNSEMINVNNLNIAKPENVIKNAETSDIQSVSNFAKLKNLNSQNVINFDVEIHDGNILHDNLKIPMQIGTNVKILRTHIVQTIFCTLLISNTLKSATLKILSLVLGEILYHISTSNTKRTGWLNINEDPNMAV